MIGSISLITYKDKIKGGWVGKCAGGILGAPIEGYKRFNAIDLNDSLFKNNFANDDLDLQLLWLDLVAKKGRHIRESNLKEHWAKHVAFPWNEYGIANRNIRLGMDNPNTGSHNNGYWKHSMGSPIRSEIWGMLCAGNPGLAAYYAKMDSTLDHDGFSVEAEQFLSACAAIAFLESDVSKILLNALDYVPNMGICHVLVTSVIEWNTRYGAEITAGKIKSIYGDADFTSAPMNIGFTVLALLKSGGKLDSLSDALHYGHDSDCIVATAGALLGMISGYENIPKNWKERVGEEILVSPEIEGIDCPPTISELTDRVCEAAATFLGRTDDFMIEDYPFAQNHPVCEKDFYLNTTILEFPNINCGRNGLLQITIENTTRTSLELEVIFTSEFFEEQNVKVSVPREQKHILDLKLIAIKNKSPKATSLSYVLRVKGEDNQVFGKAVPNYGSWLLLGPFIEDDMELVEMDKNYPDHGMSSLPSVQYMNHDVQKSTSQFIDPKNISGYDFTKAPYGVQIVYPDSMELDLGNYFYGNGERTLFLYTEIYSALALKKWLCLGHSNYCKVWLNGTKLSETENIKRRWPGTEAVELPLQKGENELLLRFDFINDDFIVNIGLKEHLEKHHHQSQWDTQLLFKVKEGQYV